MANTTKKKKINIGYIRVSTAEDRQKLGYEAQKRILNDYAIDYYMGKRLVVERMIVQSSIRRLKKQNH